MILLPASLPLPYFIIGLVGLMVMLFGWNKSWVGWWYFTTMLGGVTFATGFAGIIAYLVGPM